MLSGYPDFSEAVDFVGDEVQVSILAEFEALQEYVFGIASREWIRGVSEDQGFYSIGLRSIGVCGLQGRKGVFDDCV